MTLRRKRSLRKSSQKLIIGDINRRRKTITSDVHINKQSSIWDSSVTVVIIHGFAIFPSYLLLSLRAIEGYVT